MNGRRGAWLVLALVAGPVLAGPQEGRLEVTVLDDVTGTPLVCNPMVQVVGGEYNVQVNTNENGLAVFNPIPVGNYTVTVRPADPYFWARQTVSVGAKPPPTQITIRVERGEPTPYVEIIEPEGTVGNTVAVKYRFYLNDFHWLTRVRIEAVPDGHAAPTQEVSDLTAGQLGNSTPVGTATLSDGVTPVEIRERSVEWDTTGLYNDAYTLRVLVWYEDPWDPGGDDIDGEDERNVAVRNLCFGAVTTSANNPDYFLFDPAEGSDYEHPTVTFEIKDEGQISNEQEPYTYEWAVWAVATNTANPQEDYEACVLGERSGPGTVTAYFNDLAAQTANGQDQLGDLVTWGSFTFEIRVEEVQTEDQYWFRWPYDLIIPNTIPGTSTPGHDFYWTVNGHDKCAFGYDYYLQDNGGRDASWFQIDCFTPKLLSQGTQNNTTTAGVHHQGNVGPDLTKFHADPYLMIFRAVDNHGTDGPAWCHREHENKRMLARNGREPGAIREVMWEEVADNLPLDGNPGSGMGEPGVGRRIFPGRKTPTDTEFDLRRIVSVTVKTTQPGVEVMLRSLDVDDPSANEAPIDDEQSWPTEANSDNNDQGLPRGGFENGQEQIVKTTGRNGEVSVDFRVGLQPGDNYRIVACLKDDADGIVVKAMPRDEQARVFTFANQGAGQEEEVPSTGGPTKYRASDVLTVWQRIFYEYDRMWGTGTYLAVDAHTGDDAIWTEDALVVGSLVAVFDTTGQAQEGVEVTDCQPQGDKYVVSLDTALEHDFLMVERAYAGSYQAGQLEAALMKADASLVGAAFVNAYVVFEPTPTGGGWLPQLAVDYMRVLLVTPCFEHRQSTPNVFWLIGGTTNPTGLLGVSFKEDNWAAAFWQAIAAAHPGDEAAVVLREVTVHEFGHQFGLLDWRERPSIDEMCVTGDDGDIMLYGYPQPPSPQHPNLVTNGVARFGPSNIGGPSPSIRRWTFPP